MPIKHPPATRWTLWLPMRGCHAMNDLLIHVRSLDPWTRAAEYGVRLAALIDATVTAAFVYPSPLQVAPTYSSPELLAAIFSSARETGGLARAQAQPFLHWAREQGAAQAAWHVAEGDASRALAHIGTWHDLLVVDRGPDPATHVPAELARLILAVGLPCLVVPRHRVAQVSLDCIAIGWNGSQEAVRAIHAALPLLQRANRIVLLEGASRRAYPEITWKPPLDIDLYLQRHAVHAEHRPLGNDAGEAGEALLEGAASVGADLLVMGAYGRSRFSEWALGGATRHVLADAALPVLLRH
jgi:nucleotide-binding universal stress UspA family protein